MTCRTTLSGCMAAKWGETRNTRSRREPGGHPRHDQRVAREQQNRHHGGQSESSDPIEFRFDNTSDRELRKVLETAAAKFGWKRAPAAQRPRSGDRVRNRCGNHVAEIAEVTSDNPTGD